MNKQVEKSESALFTRRGFVMSALASMATIGFSSQLVTKVLAGSKQAVESVREVLPIAKDPSPNRLVEYAPEYVYSRSRVKYPVVRAGFLTKQHQSDTTQRGKEEFVRVSWDKALDLVAAELKRVRQKHGPNAIYAGNQNWKSSGRLHNCGTALTRLLNLYGGYCPSYTNYSTGALSVILPHVLGNWEPFTRPTVWPVVVESSELVVLWGSDPIAIDPFRSDTADYLDAEWVHLRPGTDVAMMLGMAHTLLDEELLDQAFLRKYTVGFDKFRSYLIGESDGQPKTAKWAAEICDMDAEIIESLARRMAKNRTMIMAGFSLQRAEHGEQAHWMLLTLASMLGQIGLPGGGLGFSYHYGSAGSPITNGAALGGLSGGSAPAGLPAPIPGTRISDALLNPGQVIEFNGKKVTYPDIRLIYWAGGNPFSHHQDINKLLVAWRKPETIIVNEQFWTATAKHADIVLPATTSFERNDIEQAGEFSGQFIIPMQKAVEPLFEARHDFDIFASVAARLGIGDAYTEGKSEMDWIESFYNMARRQASAKGLKMPGFEEFWQSGEPLEFPIPEEASRSVCLSDFRDNPLLEPLGTPSGKIEIYSRKIEKLDYEDCPAHPAWLEPVEWLGSRKAEQYPLHLLSPHPSERVHSQLAHVPQRRNYTIQGREPIWINSIDASTRGIKQGDLVRIFNDRGQVLGGANVSDRMRPGVIQMQEGGWYDPQEPGQNNSLCLYGDVNVLTLDKGTSALAQAASPNTTLVDVEKYRGEGAGVMAFDPPEECELAPV
jgi:trimethylamine-N-oxide reductase (cytochrome c)